MSASPLSERIRAHLDRASSSIGTVTISSTDPKEVKIAYESGLKMMHQKSGAEACTMFNCEPLTGLSTSTAERRCQQYGRNTPSHTENQLYGTEQNALAIFEKHCTVVRDGIVAEVGMELLAVGDLVFVNEGDNIPADIRILDAIGANGDKSVVDNTIPGGFGPAPVDIEPSMQSKIDQASNVALRGSKVLSGSLLGIVFGIGSRCIVCSKKISQFQAPSGQRLPRGVDKKKVAKLALKLDMLGASAKYIDRLVPFCGARNITVVLAANDRNLHSINKAIKRLVVQSYRVFVLVRKNVVPTRDIPPLGTKAIGKPINTKVVHDLSSEKGLKNAVQSLETESVVLASGADFVSDDVVRRCLQQYEQPVAFFSDDVQDKMALERATLGFCTYNAFPAALVGAAIICQRDGLERLSLYLKVLQESNEISN